MTREPAERDCGGTAEGAQPRADVPPPRMREPQRQLMMTPTVTETPLPLEAVVRDPFIAPAAEKTAPKPPAGARPLDR
jgi:hypothetical protein